LESVLLYNKDNLSIVSCVSIPVGSGVTLSTEEGRNIMKTALMKTAGIHRRHADEYDMIPINGVFLNSEGKRFFKIIMDNGDAVAVQKPRLEIKSSTTSPSSSEIFTITIEIENSIEGEVYNSVNLMINDLEVEMPIENHKCVKDIQLEDPGEYTFTIDDDRFLPVNPVIVEVS